MKPLITQAYKEECEAVLGDLHATFARPLYMFKQAQEVVITENPDHNFFFESSPTNSTTVTTIISGTYSGRVAYAREQKLTQFGSPNRGGTEDQLNITLQDGTVRIKLDPSGAAFMRDATRVRLDGDIFEITTDHRPHGLFDPKWYTFFLKRIN